MSDLIKLDELRAAIDAMTPGPYVYDGSGWIEAPSDNDDLCEVLVLGGHNRGEDGVGTAAILNAAKALLDIAESALEYRDACYASGRGSPGRRASGIAALNKALAKVTR